MAGSIFDRFRNMLSTPSVAAKPFTEQGVSGFRVSGGFVEQPERNPALTGMNRWHTAADILTNVSVVAAGARYSLNLVSRPKWRADPPSDKPEAKAMAEFVEEVINGIDTSWSRIIRRSAIYRYHGFNLQEWVAKKRDDGKIGIAAVEPRPAHTITKWDTDKNGGVLGVVQTSPQTGQEIYLPRKKMVYLVDDALTDNPEGMGWFRHLADPAQRLRRYLKLETMGFERDLAGIPIGRAPIVRINQLVADGKLKREQADQMIKSLEQFVSLKAKEPSTGLVLDSEPFRARGADGAETISSVMQWGLELLTGNPSSVEALGHALERLMYDMAMIIGTESMLIGKGGQGSRALSEDKSKNLYLTANAALGDMTEAYDRDIVTTLWMMNGFDEELRPKLKAEDVAFKDAEAVAKSLADMANAGAILHPNDPAINDLRDLMGISHALPVDETTANLMLESKAGVTQTDPNADPNAPGSTGSGRPSRTNPGSGGGPGGKPPTKPPVKKYSPDQLRDYHGRWTDEAGGLSSANPLKPGERLFERDGKIGGVTVDGTPDGWHISDLRAISPGGGREALQNVTDLADKNGIKLSLIASPSNVDPPGLKDQLVKWYEGFGFQATRGNDSAFMVRYPNVGRDLYGSLAGRGRGIVPGDVEQLSQMDELIDETIVNRDLPDWYTDTPYGAAAQAARRLGKFDPSEPRDDHGRWTDGSALGLGLIDKDGLATDKGMEIFSEHWIGGSWEIYQQTARSVVSGQTAAEFAEEVGSPKAAVTHDFIAGVMKRINGSAVDYPLYRGLVGVDYNVGDTFSESLTTWTAKESLARNFSHDAYFTAGVGSWNHPQGVVFKVAGSQMHGINITKLNEYASDPHAPALLRTAAEHITSGRYRVVSIEGAGTDRTFNVERIGDAITGDLKKVVEKYSPDQPRDDHGRWTDEGGGASVLFEVAPNPDNMELTRRWASLSQDQKLAITDSISKEFTPQVLEALGVHGTVEDAVGGFEGEINPSLYLTVDEKPFEVAGAIGDTFQQKAMVVFGDGPGPGLDEHGLVSIHVPGADDKQLRSIQEKIGGLADGWTYHNDRMQVLNFSGTDDRSYAESIDRALGGQYSIEHAKVYSAYIEERDYVRPGSDSKGNPWGEIRGHLRQEFSQRLEENLKGSGKG